MIRTIVLLFLAVAVFGQALLPVRPTLGRILRDSPQLDAQKIGHLLAAVKGRVVGGLRLERVAGKDGKPATRGGAGVWRVVKA